jgi:hypothetical protein
VAHAAVRPEQPASDGRTAATVSTERPPNPGADWRDASGKSDLPSPEIVKPAAAAAPPASGVMGHAKNVLAAVGVLALIAQALRLAR